MAKIHFVTLSSTSNSKLFDRVIFGALAMFPLAVLAHMNDMFTQQELAIFVATVGILYAVSVSVIAPIGGTVIYLQNSSFVVANVLGLGLNSILGLNLTTWFSVLPFNLKGIIFLIVYARIMFSVLWEVYRKLGRSVPL